MPIANYADYVDRVKNITWNLGNAKALMGAGLGRSLISSWTATPLAGTAPTTPTTPTNVTVGALPFVNSAAVQRLAQVEASLGGILDATVLSSGVVIICDRLSHQGGLSGTVTTGQTTNLPTAPLTRYTDGVGVMAALEIYTAVGSTSTTVRASYTNELGISGKITSLTAFGGGGQQEVGRFLILSLANSDRGVRSIESVTLSASTGTAGNFGVTLFKPLFIMPIQLAGYRMLFDSILGMCGNVPQVFNDACLFFCNGFHASISTCLFQANIAVIRE